MSEDIPDCLECRLVSGGGLLCAGIYLAYCGQRFTNFNRYVLLAVGPGVGLLGILRLFNYPLFKHSLNEIEKPKEISNDQQSYIIGKLPTKFR